MAQERDLRQNLTRFIIFASIVGGVVIAESAIRQQLDIYNRKINDNKITLGNYDPHFSEFTSVLGVSREEARRMTSSMTGLYPDMVYRGQMSFLREGHNTYMLVIGEGDNFKKNSLQIMHDISDSAKIDFNYTR